MSGTGRPRRGSACYESKKGTGRGCTPGSCPVCTAFRRREPPYWGGAGGTFPRPLLSHRFLWKESGAAGGRASIVGTSYGSLASPQAAKLVPSTVPLLPSRHCDSRARLARQSSRSFSPARFIRHWRRFAGKLSPPNPLRSRWRLCRLTDAACPLRVLRWASAGAPSMATTGRPYGHGGWHARRGRRAPRAGGSGGGGMISTPTGRGSYPPAGQAPPYPSSSRSTCPAERAKSRAAARASWRVLPWVPTSTSTEPVDSCWLYREERMVMGRARVG